MNMLNQFSIKARLMLTMALLLAFLCSAQAGFISGQNLQLDGGSYEGLI